MRSVVHRKASEQRKEMILIFFYKKIFEKNVRMIPGSAAAHAGARLRDLRVLCGEP
jgi:hypothetical protein